MRWIVMVVVLMYGGMALWQAYKPLPEGMAVSATPKPAKNVAFLSDETWVSGDSQRRSDQAIFDEVLRLIAQAERLVVLDMFLFNDFGIDLDNDFRPISHQLTEALIRRKTDRPDMTAVVITDPINTFYGGLSPEHLTALGEAGINVIMTDLTRLRASNPTWSGIWTLCCRAFGNTSDGGWLPNVLGPGQVTLRSYLQLLNFNANHRKTLIVDEGEEWTGLVTSANPHDASSHHDNVALRFSGPAVLDLLDSERMVARLSGMPGAIPPSTDPMFRASTLDVATTSAQDTPQVQLLAESGIRDALLASVQGSTTGDRLDIAVFYLAHRELIEAFKAAQARGVTLRVLLDPNRDAFGVKKNGIPNRPVGHELHTAGVPLRWCDTHGEQCHSKFLLNRPRQGPAELIVGSANYTRRNLDDLNLETSVRLVAQRDLVAISDAQAFFDRQWGNPEGRGYSVAYEAYADPSWRRYWQYRLMEATGLSTF